MMRETSYILKKHEISNKSTLREKRGGVEPNAQNNQVSRPTLACTYPFEHADVAEEVRGGIQVYIRRHW